MTIKTILVPTDFSEPSAAAIVYARQLADALRASLHLVLVIPDPAAQPWAEEAYTGSLSEMLTQLKSRAQRNLQDVLPAPDRRKYRAQLVVAVGAPLTRIIEYAKKTPVDLIVMGTHGRGALAHAILGSVTERVMRLAPCPVLAVRTMKRKKPPRQRRKGSSRSRPTARSV
jgi:nucleotide-binding universal stress UspA family protein